MNNLLGRLCEFRIFEITALTVLTRDLNNGSLDLKAGALPLCQAGTCMSKVGTMCSMPQAGQMKWVKAGALRTY